MYKKIYTTCLLLITTVSAIYAQQLVKASNVNLVTSPGTKIVINGGITFVGTSNFKDSGEVYLRPNTTGKENWTDSTAAGVYDVNSNGKVYFESDSFQYIYGNTRFYNLRSFSDSGVVLLTNSEVRNIMNLDKKLMYTPSTKMYVSNPALNAIQSTNGFTTSWVNGKLERAANIAGTGLDGNDYVLQVGNDTLYAPVKLSKFNTNTARFMAEYFYNPPPNMLNVFSPPIDHISKVEYWRISSNIATGTDDDARVWLSWRGRSYVSGTAGIRDSLLVAQYINRPPDIWDVPNGWVTGNTIGPDSLSGYVRSNGYYSIYQTSTNYTPFTLATYSRFNALPVNILYFTAIGDGNKVRLNWDVRDEQEVNKYEVEKSLNGTTFVKIDDVTSLRKPAWLYTDFDLSPVDGWNYYRLRIIDIRGKISYSDIRKVRFEKGAMDIKLFPNPANSIVNILIPTVMVGNTTMQLYSADGKYITSLKPTNSSIQLNVAPLAKGSYFVRIVNNDSIIKTLPFIKQ